MEEALRNIALVEATISGIELPQPYLLHGFDAVAGKLFRHAVARGYDVRVSFEDAFMLANGAAAKSNSELVAAAATVIFDDVAT